MKTAKRKNRSFLRIGYVLVIGFMLTQIAATYPVINSMAIKTCGKLFPATGKWSTSFFDLIDGGTCWSCPKGTKRTAASVKAGNACVGFKKATKRGVYGCKRKYGSSAFYDPIEGGSCWTCPKGFKRTVFSVKSGKACERWNNAFSISHSRATKRGKNGCDKGFSDPIDGGTCWTCPSGAKRTVFSVKSDKACELSTKALKRGNNNLGKQVNQLSASQKAEFERIAKQIEKAAQPAVDKVTELHKDLKNSNLSPQQFKTLLKANNTREIERRLNIDRVRNMFSNINISSSIPTPSKVGGARQTSPPRFQTMSFGLVADASILFGGNIEEGIVVDLKDRSRKPEVYLTAGWSIGASAGADASMVYGFWVDKDISGYGEGVTMAASYYAGMAVAFWWANSASDTPGKFLGFTLSPQFGAGAEVEYGRNITMVK